MEEKAWYNGYEIKKIQMDNKNKFLCIECNKKPGYNQSREWKR